MKKGLWKYSQFVGETKINEIYEKASKLEGKHIIHINSTYQGGGVAEILNALIPLMNEIGVDAGWRILHGSQDFFTTTKKFFNALQGDDINLTNAKKRVYIETNKKFSTFTHIHHDCVIVHDIPPLPLIRFYRKKQPWIWRCHTDISSPEKGMMSYLKQFINSYDAAVLLSKRFVRKEISPSQLVMPPSIDPLSAKNKEIKDAVIDKYLDKYGITADKPLLCQISRFDKFKDHEGVINIFKEVRKRIACRLVLIGVFASDDPLSQKIYEDVLKKISGDKDITLINTPNDILVNSLQRKSSVIYQKSFKEGFGLTVTEAMWKGAPVIASRIGGIQDQITDGKNGFLLQPADNRGFVERTVQILKNPLLKRRISDAAKKTVKEKFLITTHILNWTNLLNKILLEKK